MVFAAVFRSYLDILLCRPNRRQSRPQRQNADAKPIEVREVIGREVECLRALTEGVEGGCDVAYPPDFERGTFEAQRASRCLHLLMDANDPVGGSAARTGP
jgi:hypothetical protein